MGALVYATRAALEDGRRLIPGVCLENVVEAEIVAGNVTAGARRGFVFDREKRWVAEVERVPGRIRERPRAWLVTAIEPHSEGRA